MTTNPIPRPTTRYRCTHSISPLCDKGEGKPTRKKCGYCGGGWRVETGWWGLFTWDAKNLAESYEVDRAHGLYRSEKKAEDARGDRDWVIRWVGKV